MGHAAAAGRCRQLDWAFVLAACELAPRANAQRSRVSAAAGRAGADSSAQRRGSGQSTPGPRKTTHGSVARPHHSQALAAARTAQQAVTRARNGGTRPGNGRESQGVDGESCRGRLPPLTRPTPPRTRRRPQQSVVASFSESELSEFREIFDLVDRDGGGTISKQELASLLETLGVGTSAVCCDSAGRVPWRRGCVAHALGASGGG